MADRKLMIDKMREQIGRDAQVPAALLLGRLLQQLRTENALSSSQLDR